MFCSNCGKEIPANNNFCPHCGSPANPNAAQNTNNYNYNNGNNQGSTLNSGALAAVAYLTLIGLIIAAIVGDRNDPFFRFHLNQALVIFLFGLLGVIPIIGWIWDIFILVCTIMGIVYAIQGQMKEVPLLGQIRIIK